MLDAKELLFIGAVNFFVATASSIAGGGGGFVMTPLLLSLGLSPQQIVASGKPLGLAVSLGNLQSMRKNKTHVWKSAAPLAAIALAMGLIATQLISDIDRSTFKNVVGICILAMAIVLHLSKVGLRQHIVTPVRRMVGYVVAALNFLLVGVFGSGLGSTIGPSISYFFGYNAVEANINKRLAQLVLNTVIMLGLLGTGFIVWPMVVVGSIFGWLGASLGAKVVLRKGSKFVMITLEAMMVLSALYLLVS